MICINCGKETSKYKARCTNCGQYPEGSARARSTGCVTTFLIIMVAVVAWLLVKIF